MKKAQILLTSGLLNRNIAFFTFCSLWCTNPLEPRNDFLLGIRVGGLSISLWKGFALGEAHIGSNTGGDKSPLFNFDTFDSSSLACCRSGEAWEALDESNFNLGRFIGLTEGRCCCAALAAAAPSACSRLYLRGRPGRRLTGVVALAASESWLAMVEAGGCSWHGVGDLRTKRNRY